MQHSRICECSKSLNSLVMDLTRKSFPESYGSSTQWIISKHFRLVRFILLLIIMSRLHYNILSNVPVLMKHCWECPKLELLALLQVTWHEYKKAIKRSTTRMRILRNL